MRSSSHPSSSGERSPPEFRAAAGQYPGKRSVLMFMAAAVPPFPTACKSLGRGTRCQRCLAGGASWGQPAETLKVIAGLARRGALIAGPYRIKEPSSARNAAGASLATFAVTMNRLPSSLTLDTKPL